MENPEFLKQYHRRLTRGRTRNAGTERLLTERGGRRRCFACSEYFPTLTKHHIKPVAKDGESWVENLVRLCPNCHALVHYCNEKTDKSIHERRDCLLDYQIERGRAFKIAILSTEEVYVNSEGLMQPRTKLIPQESLTHTELYAIYNWWPKNYVGESTT